MKTGIHVILSVLLLTSARTQDYSTSSELKPQTLTMKEWWKEDGNGYGVNGFTWLDNFYHGSGALAISTPKGVQTWLLNHPWDTVSVFNWTNGDANIISGDFNGDSITDYLDGKGSLYLGRAQDVPGSPRRVIADDLPTRFVCDINNDGMDDAVLVDQNTDTVGLRIWFGSRNDSVLTSQVLFEGRYFDSSRKIVSIYAISNKKVRVLIRLAPYKIDKHGDFQVTSDGYELYDANWNSSTKSLSFTRLHEITLNNAGLSWLAGCTLRQSDGTMYRIDAERISIYDTWYTNTNLAVYSLSNDSIKKIASIRMDSIYDMVALNHSIDADSLSDFVLNKGDGYSLSCVSGNFSNGITILSRYTFCSLSHVCTVKTRDDSTSHSLCVGGQYMVDGEPYNCLTIAHLDETLSSVKTDRENPTGVSISAAPEPVIRGVQELQLRVSSTTPHVCELCCVTEDGKVTNLGHDIAIAAGETTVHVDTGLFPAGGAYSIVLLDKSVLAHCRLIVK